MHCTNQRMTFLLHILLIIIKLSYGSKDPPPNTVQIPKAGVFLTRDQEVLGYQGYITVPYTLVVPLLTPKNIINSILMHMNTSTPGFSCPLDQTIDHYNTQAESYLREIIPPYSIIPPDYSNFEAAFNRTESVIQFEKEDLRGRHMLSNTIKERISINKDIFNNNSYKNVTPLSPFIPKSRQARNPILIAAGIIAVGSGLAGFIWNRIDISNLKDKMELIDTHFEELESYLNKQTTIINEMVDNDSWLIGTTTMLHKDMQALIDTVNCQSLENTLTHEYLQSWLYISINGFVTAVNNAILGDLSIYLLPSHTLESLLKNSQMEASLYKSNPLYIYQYGKFEITHISHFPPSVSGIIILPHITNQRIGTLYQTSTCPFNLPKGLMELRLSHSVLYDDVDNEWLTSPLTPCITGIKEILCHKSQVHLEKERCLEYLVNASTLTFQNTSCAIQLADQSYTGRVIPIKYGVIACLTKGKVLIVRTKETGIKKSKILVMSNNSMLLSPIDGEEVIYNDELFVINHNHLVNVETGAWEVELNSTILDHLNNLTAVPFSLKHLEKFHYSTGISSHHDIIQYVLISVIVILSIVVLIFMKKHMSKQNNAISILAKYSPLLWMENEMQKEGKGQSDVGRNSESVQLNLL
uniref:Fusion glycoprotein n=1 Tax=Crocidura lasiura lispivirus 2 TaxID=3139472 RepID=A0AB38ZJN9_9MONO